MDVRYAGEYANEPDLALTDNVGSITNGNPFMGRLTTLRCETARTECRALPCH